MKLVWLFVFLILFSGCVQISYENNVLSEKNVLELETNLTKDIVDLENDLLETSSSI